MDGGAEAILWWIMVVGWKYCAVTLVGWVARELGYQMDCFCLAYLQPYDMMEGKPRGVALVARKHAREESLTKPLLMTQGWNAHRRHPRHAVLVKEAFYISTLCQRQFQIGTYDNGLVASVRRLMWNRADWRVP